jgi:hypothetical protein
MPPPCQRDLLYQVKIGTRLPGVCVWWCAPSFNAWTHSKRDCPQGALTHLRADWTGSLVRDGDLVSQSWQGRRQSCWAHLMRTAQGLAERVEAGIARFGGRRHAERQRLCPMGTARPTVGQWRAWDARCRALVNRPAPREDKAGTFLREVGLALGIGNMRQEHSAIPPERHATPQEGTGGPHLRRIAIRLRQPTTPEEGRNFWRIALVMFGLAAMNRWHGEGLAQDEGHAFSGTESSQPIPGKDTRDGHHQMVTIGRNGLQERLWSGFHVAVHEDFTVMAHNADVHAAGMQVDATIQWMLFGVESHRVSSVANLISYYQHTTGVS